MSDPVPQSKFPRWVWTTAWLGCWGVLAILTHMPKLPSAAPRGNDKVMHIVAYFVLTMLGGIAAHMRGVKLTYRWGITWFLIYAAYAAADELLQPLTGRYCELTDWFADMIGVTAAMCILLLHFGGKEEQDQIEEPDPTQADQ